MTKTTRTDLKKFLTGIKHPAEPPEANTEIDEEKLENKLLNYLSRRASYVSELGRELSEEFNKAPNKLRVDCHRILRPHASSGAIRRRKLDDSYGNTRVYYFSRNAAESLFHKAMISLAKGLIAREGFKLVAPHSGCDCAFKFNDLTIGLECESGLKSDLGKFAKKLSRRCKKYYEVWVICRNTKDRERYRVNTKSKFDLTNVKFKTLKSCKETLRRIK